MILKDRATEMTGLGSEEENLIDPRSDKCDADDTNSYATAVRGKESKGVLSGWRFGVLNCVMSVTLVLLVNIIITLVVGAHYGYTDGLGVLFDGSCDAVRRYNVVGHLVINILSTILLSGSNYCMQCLSAPTRQEVDKAHSKGVTLDIGIPSMRNLGYISRKRLTPWIMLACSSLPLHLFFNSVMYTSISANDYLIVAVNNAFIQPGPVNLTAVEAPWNAPNSLDPELITSLRTAALSGSLQYLDKTDCINSYAQDYLSTRSNLLLVLSTSSNNASAAKVVNAWEHYNLVVYQNTGCAPDAYSWICGDECLVPCQYRLQNVLSNVNNWQPYGMNIDHCLSQTTEEHCKLQFSLYLIVIVIIFNFIKAILMAYLAFGLTASPMMTIGDAIASFLNDTDGSTKGCCLHSRREFEALVDDLDNSDGPKWVHGPRQWTMNRKRWFSASSKTRWMFFFMLYFSAIVGCVTLLAYGIVHIVGPKDISTLWNLGLGAVHTGTLINWSIPSTGSAGLIGCVLLANLAQPILSFLYFLYNGLFTCMLAELEWSNLIWVKKGVRVSNKPQGDQRSSYFLQLPYRYAIPIMMLSGVLHWLVSQSIFLVDVQSYDFAGQPDQCLGNSYQSCGSHLTCGWSPAAIMSVIIVGVFMIAFGFLTGRRRYRAGMPLAASSSTVISAACHVNRELEPKDLPYLRIKWGVMSTGDTNDEIGHCAFSALEPKMPEEGHLYS
ncbi:hypothetical protein MMC26_002774 [Xylographa opegraphella]|nr:hypothetical protein [Xylographa opegraphella]